MVDAKSIPVSLKSVPRLVWSRLALLIVFASPVWGQFYTSQTFAGGGFPYDENALTAHLSYPRGPVLDAQGALYVSLASSIVVRVAGGRVVRVAGNGIQGFKGDGGPALDAELAGPAALAVDHAGSLYIYDSLNSRVRKVDAATGTITTIAGNGEVNSTTITLGGSALSLSLGGEGSLALDPAGNLYIAGMCRIIKVDAKSGLTGNVAGTGECGFAGDGGPATSAQVSFVGGGIASDASGTLYIADSSSNRIRQIDAATGIIRTVAGGGAASADGVPATSVELRPSGVAVDLSGNLYIPESRNYRVRKVDASLGMIATVAGTGVGGYSGDGGPATAAKLGPNLAGVAVDAAGSLFIADGLNDRVRRVDAVTGIITTFAGDGPGSFSGDGGPASNCQISSAVGVALDASGNLYIADRGNSRVRKVDAASGIINTVAGNGVQASYGDGGLATAAAVDPVALAVDRLGNLFIVDAAGYRVRKVNAAGVISTFAGGGSTIYFDHGPATSVRLASPDGIATDASGNVYVSDYQGPIYKIVQSTGMLTTFAGGVTPQGIALDSRGNLYIAEIADNCVVRMDAATGNYTTLAGTCARSGGVDSGDGGPATAAQLYEPNSLAVDTIGNVLIGGKGGYIRRVDAATGIISTVAGCGPTSRSKCLASAEGVLATNVVLYYLNGLAAAPTGEIYVANGGTVLLLKPVPADVPMIGGVRNAAYAISLQASAPISPGAWITITGANLSPTTRSWTAADFQGITMPLSLDGVSITVNGVAAAISYISPGQINAQCPDISVKTTTATVDVQVQTQGNLTQTLTVPIAPLGPALFAVASTLRTNQLYATALHLDGTLVGEPGDFGVASTRPAVPGETISLFGTGFGPTIPPIPAGIVPAAPEQLTAAVNVVFNIVKAQVSYAGVVQPGLVQINLVVPQVTADVAPNVSANGIYASTQGLLLPVRAQ
jgi:uncharacterized protein (TIGR03437 family)